MKKLLLIGIAVLLAMTACDNFTAPDAVNQPPAAPGELVINIRSSGNSRALTSPIAEAAADFFEVVFDNGTKAVRTSWGNGKTGRIIPADGDYDNTGTDKAYLFAGKNGTLLGIGTIFSVTNGATVTPGAVINMATATGVTFVITSLNTDVKAADDSTFKTWTAATAPAGSFSLLTIDEIQGLEAPVFNFAPGTGAETAAFNITAASGALNANLQSAILVAPGATAANSRVISRGFIWEEGDAPMANVTGTIAISYPVPTAGAALTLPIPMTITPGTKEGLSRIYIEVPVILYSATAGVTASIEPFVWTIRGGLNNSLLDYGKLANATDGSQGGAILIGVGDYQKNMAGLIIDPGL